MEIERKFTFNVDLLELFPLPSKDSEGFLGGWKSEKTYYLPNSGNYDIRLRWKENFITPTWKLTIKSKPTFSSRSLNRLEIEKNLSKWIVFPFFYNKIYIKSLLENEWVPANENEKAILVKAKMLVE